MKKIAGIVLILLTFALKGNAQIYMADSCRAVFFSAATIEDITAANTISKPIMNTSTGELDVKLNNQFFKFKKELMEEHFNEDYMETKKFQYTTFTGKINETVDYKKDGVNQVTVTGTMDMHGVKKTITVPGTITVQNGILFLKAVFNVKPGDYSIKIPSMLGNNIAESLAITFTATMKPFGAK
jgi:polyisoprenoid-binding protein YceI